MNKLRNLLRFSLLELLWICGVLAVFLGLNLRMTPIQENWFYFGNIVHHDYNSYAGWPMHFLSIGCSVQRSVGNVRNQRLEIEQIKNVLGVKDIEQFPGYVPGMEYPELTQAWPIGKIHTIPLFVNIFFALFSVFAPLWPYRLYKRSKIQTPETPNLSVR